MIQVATGDRIDGLEPISMLKAKKKEGRLQNWEGNLFHLQYLRQTKEVRSEQSHRSLIVAAHRVKGQIYSIAIKVDRKGRTVVEIAVRH